MIFFFKKMLISEIASKFHFSEFVFAGRCHFVATSCDHKFVPHRRARTLQPLRESTYQGIALLTFLHMVIYKSGLPAKDIAFDFLFSFLVSMWPPS